MLNLRAITKGGSLHGSRKMAGLTLIELMIAIVLGMIVIAGVIQVFVGSVRSNTELLRMTRLEEELSSILTLMSADIRRAGFNTEATDQDLVATGWTNDMATLTVNGAGNCILYTYDSEGDASAGNIANQFGFRLIDGTIQMFTNQGNWTCNGANGWAPASSTNVVTINDLSFGLTQSCINATNSARDCAGSALAGDTLVTTRFVDISLEGQLSADGMVRRTLQESVRIRNDQVTFVAGAGT